MVPGLPDLSLIMFPLFMASVSVITLVC